MTSYQDRAAAAAAKAKLTGFPPLALIALKLAAAPMDCYASVSPARLQCARGTSSLVWQRYEGSKKEAAWWRVYLLR